MLQGTGEEMDACLQEVRRGCPEAEVRELSEREFDEMKRIRAAASDEAGVGVRRAGSAAEGDPVKRASAFLADSIREFRKRGIRPKAEHNFGMLRVFLEEAASRAAYRRAVEAGEAFDDGTLALYRGCGGDVRAFFRRFLAPRVTEEMVRSGTAVNFPGDEDLLIRAERFPDTVALLDALIEKHGACPVPLYYCHLNFRRKPGWILVHNRLLMDPREFP